MRIFQLIKCSWYHVATVISIVSLISVAPLFFMPIHRATIYYFSDRSMQNSFSSLRESVGAESENLNKNFEVKIDFNKSSHSYGAVIYRGAPWKAEIGKWFSGCDPVLRPIDIVESISGKQCKNNCSGLGVCNNELGQCRCFHGYYGEDCSKKVHFGCNHPSSEEYPYGRPVPSMCPVHCDTTRAMCFCGEGTKYPNRPVAEECGFRYSSGTDIGGVIIKFDPTKADHENIYTTNASRPGWCNVDPEKAYASKVKFKEDCDCKYDCQKGRFCEIPTLCSCLNQCSGHGYCRGGFCQCDNDWYGIDCSVPSTSAALKEYPIWLQPSTVNIPEKASLNRDMKVNAIVKKTRPLIYVYDLPPELNSHLLEGRHFKYDFVNRIYSAKNRTLWTEQLYGSQMALLESILASPHRTLNGEEADYFYVPVLDSIMISRADDAPHLNAQKHLGLRSFMTLNYYKDAHTYIIEHHPYWNRSSGKDHIWFFSWDEGACCAPKEIWNSMMLVHWGNTNSIHKNSTTGYEPDSWDRIPSDRRGDHPCYDPSKDLVLPAWKRPDPEAIKLKFWSRPRKERTTLFYFNGNLGHSYQNGRLENKYSIGLRQKLAYEFGSSPNKKGKLGRQHRSDVTVSPLQSAKYHEEISRSLFCGVLPGDGWSGRMEDSVLHGCIPVIIQDGIFLPYENVLNYENFAVRVAEDDIPNLINILEAFSESEIESMLGNVRQIWQRFLYRDSILLEARRQKRLFDEEAGWAVEVSKLEEDDVFSTFIQILHYKLHNDPWRQQLPQQKKYGLPEACLKAAN